MSKTLLTVLFSTLLLTSGCTDKKKETQTIVQKETIEIESPQSELNGSKSFKSEPIITPFKPTIDTSNIKEEVITESLEELEAAAFKTIQPQIMDEMQKIPDCLENAETKEEAFACSQTLRALNQELAMAMGDFSEEEPVEGYDDEFVWNEGTKVNMIKEIEAGTQAMQEMQTCIETSKTAEEFEKCLRP